MFLIYLFLSFRQGHFFFFLFYLSFWFTYWHLRYSFRNWDINYGLNLWHWFIFFFLSYWFLRFWDRSFRQNNWSWLRCWCNCWSNCSRSLSKNCWWWCHCNLSYCWLRFFRYYLSFSLFWLLHLSNFNFFSKNNWLLFSFFCKNLLFSWLCLS